MLRRFVGPSLLLVAAVSIACAQGRPIPQVVKPGDKCAFLVDGRPFLMLGGQVDNRVFVPAEMAKVRAALRQRGLVLLRADWTNRDSRITEALAAFDRSAVPLDLIYAPGRDAPLLLPELLTPDLVLDALA
jgi:hypothetical protein